MPAVNPDTGKQNKKPRPKATTRPAPAAPAPARPGRNNGGRGGGGGGGGGQGGGGGGGGAGKKNPTEPAEQTSNLSLQDIVFTPYQPPAFDPIDFSGFPAVMSEEEMRAMAENDTYLAMQPILDALAAQERSSTQQYDQRRGQVAALYDGLGAELAALSGAYAPQAQAISDQYLASMNQLAGMFGGTTGALSPEEVAAGQSVGQANAGAVLGLLADAQQRGLNYNNSTIRQGQMENVVTQRNLAADLQNILDEIGMQRSNYQRDYQAQVNSQLNALRQRMMEQQMAQAQFQIQAQLQQAGMAQDSSQFGANLGFQQQAYLGDRDLAGQQLAMEAQRVQQGLAADRALQKLITQQIKLQTKKKNGKKRKNGGRG